MTDVDDDLKPAEDAETQKERSTALHLLSAIRTKSDLDKLIWAGVTEDCFAPWENYSGAYRYIVGRVEKGHTPSRVDVASKCKVQLLVGATDVMAYVEDVMNAHYERQFSAALEQLGTDVENNPILVAINLMRERLPINLALANTRQAGVISGGSEWVEVPEPPKWVVKPILPEKWPTFVYGAGGSAKSYMAIYLAACVATGANFFIWPTHQKKVLYLDWEMDSSIFWKRVAYIHEGMGIGNTRVNEDTKKQEIHVDGLYYKSLEGSLEQCLMDIISYIIDKQIDVVIIDSFGAAMGGGHDFIKASDSLNMMANLFRLAAVASVLVIDHIGKQGQGADGPYGSVYKMNLARWAWYVKGVSNPDDMEPGTYLRWENMKYNILSRQQDLYFHITWTENGHEDEFVWRGKSIGVEHAPEELAGKKAGKVDVIEQASASTRQCYREIEHAGAAGISRPELIATTGYNEKSVDGATDSLERKGVITSRKEKRHPGKGAPEWVYRLRRDATAVLDTEPTTSLGDDDPTGVL